MGRTRAVGVALAVWLALGHAAYAQAPQDGAAAPADIDPQSLIVRNPFQPAPPVPVPPTRPTILPPLYVSFGALQIFDGYTTTQKLGKGAREANPFFAPFAAHPGAVWAMKAGVTATAIVASEQLWRRRHRAQAIAVMIVSNAVLGFVAARNASVARANP